MSACQINTFTRAPVRAYFLGTKLRQISYVCIHQVQKGLTVLQDLQENRAPQVKTVRLVPLAPQDVRD